MQGLLSSRSMLCFEVGLSGSDSDWETDWQILRGVFPMSAIADTLQARVRLL